MKRFSFLSTLILSGFLLLNVTGCDEDTTPTDPADPDVTAPTNLVAASDNQAVLLKWSASISESQSNFGKYKLTVFNKSTNTSDAPLTIDKGTTSIRVTGLSNGTTYIFTLRAVTSKEKESSGFAQVEWAPAVRHNADALNQPIRVYATTSTTFFSAVDLFNASGKAEVISQAGVIFQNRGSLYVYAPNSSTTYLEIISPDQANNQGLLTQFSTMSGDFDNLDDQYQSSPPDGNTYTSHTIRVDAAVVSKNKVYFGRLVRGSDYYYFRLMVRRGGGGSLVQGSGNDRFLEMVVSFQSTKNVVFSKQ